MPFWVLIKVGKTHFGGFLRIHLHYSFLFNLNKFTYFWYCCLSAHPYGFGRWECAMDKAVRWTYGLGIVWGDRTYDLCQWPLIWTRRFCNSKQGSDQIFQMYNHSNKPQFSSNTNRVRSICIEYYTIFTLIFLENH